VREEIIATTIVSLLDVCDNSSRTSRKVLEIIKNYVVNAI